MGMREFSVWLLGVPSAPAQREAGDAPAESDGGPVLPSRSARGSVGASEALGLIAVYRAVNIRATALRQLSLNVERAEKIIDRPLILRRPSQGVSLGQFLEMTSVSRNTAGNAYWRIYRDTAGSVQELEVLNPHDVVINTDASGKVTGYSIGAGRDLKPNEVQHIAGMRVPGTPYGLGPIQAAAAEIRGALDLRDYASEWINSGDTPSGILSSDAHLTEDNAKAAKKQWKDSRGGKRSVAVLGNGFKYAPVYISPADAQFIESRNFDTTAIARLFGVPSSLMLAPVEGTNLTYSNVSQEWLAFIRFGLADEIREIEDAFTAILPRGQRARFNVEALLRLDTASRYAAHEVGIRSGWLLPSEVRAIEGLDPVVGIDDRAPKSSPAPKEAA